MDDRQERRTAGTRSLLSVVCSRFSRRRRGRGRQYALATHEGDWEDGFQPGTGSSGWWGYTQAGGISEAGSYNASRQESSGLPGLSYFRNRIYDQASGQWTQEDPLGLAGGLNLYQYAGGNPAMFTDPFGLSPDSVTVACRNVDVTDLGTHCAVRIQNEDVDETFELLRSSSGLNHVGQATSDQVARYNGNWVRSQTPEGMTDRQYDNQVRGHARLLAKERAGQGYSPAGGKNSNRYVYDALKNSGGSVPYAAVVKQHPGVAPGICGGHVAAEGSDCQGKN